MIIRRVLSILIALASVSGARAQYFQYSQYNFTAQRVNPAYVAASDYAYADFIHRNQSTGGDFNLKSTMVSFSYPLLSRRDGHRWSGIGVSILDDRSGGIFSTREASLSYAVNVFLSRFQSLTLGFKGLYQQRKINLDGLYTGSQYVADRGFDVARFNGENIQFLQNSFFTLSSGLLWQEVDKQGNRMAYWHAAFFDVNKPQDSFSGYESRLRSTFVFGGGLRLYERANLSFTPEILFTRGNAKNVINLGGITGYQLGSTSDLHTRLDFVTKYAIGRSGVLGIQFHKNDFSVGFSYDFPVVLHNVGNTGAFEIGLELRRLVDPRLKRKSQSRLKTPSSGVKKPPARQKPVAKVALQQTKKDSLARGKVNAKPDFKTTLQHKQDSAIAKAEAGNIGHQPLLLEKVVLHFNFEFNSSDLDETSTKYLDDLTAALLENKHLNIDLTGHTDNVGSEKFNQRLSLYRANAIKEYLVEKGIESERIKTSGKGMSEPLNQNRTETEKALNRRVELMILYED
jgi:type IX secretion system PorP/SprF family membrane protein